MSNANKAYLECRRPASGRVDPTRLHVLEPHDTGAKALLVEISLGSKEKGVDGMRTISSFLASFLLPFFLPSFFGNPFHNGRAHGEHTLTMMRSKLMVLVHTSSTRTSTLPTLTCSDAMPPASEDPVGDISPVASEAPIGENPTTRAPVARDPHRITGSNRIPAAPGGKVTSVSYSANIPPSLTLGNDRQAVG